MKVKAKEFLTYKGEVTVSVLHNDKVVKTITTHNEGYKPLFDFLMYCLSNNYHSNMAPKYLRVFKESSETGADISLRSILANSTPEYNSSETESSVTLSFVVPYSSISEPTASIKYFKIYSKDNINTSTNPSAMITLKNPITISANSNLLVAWKMTISNN